MDLRDEFNYHAITLIFGRKSPKLEDLKIYNLEIMKQYPEIKFSEMSGLTVENVQDINRKLLISETRSFIANNCRISSGVCRTVTFYDTPNRIQAKDDLFTVEEYEYFLRNWDVVVKNKIRTLGMLIRSVHTGKLIDVPLLINEFPKITSVLLSRPDIWVRD